MHPPRLEPWWLERQLDPDSADFTPGGGRQNVTHRSWTVLGNLGTHERGAVDPRGWVTPGWGGWSLDWWIGADDRWHLPSREVAVRQRPLDDTPVVETSMRVPGGDAVHRAFAASADGLPWLVVEVRNDTAVPFAVAFAVRPAGPVGDVAIGRVAVDAAAITVDGAPAVLLPRAPNRVAVGTAEADAVHAVTAGLASAELPVAVDDPAGGAHAVVVYPLPHTATVRVAVPLRAPGAIAARDRRRGTPAPALAPAPAFPAGLPPADQVARGWVLQGARGARIELPDDHLAAAFTASRRRLLLAQVGEDLATWPARPLPWTEAAAVVGALDRLGLHDEAAQVIGAVANEQSLDGALGPEPGATGAALWAVGEHWRLARDAELVEALLGPVAKAAHRVGSPRRARRGSAPAAGATTDRWWAVAGLSAAAEAVAAVGQPAVADDLARFAAELRAALGRPGHRPDPGWLLAGALGALDPGDAALVAAVEVVRVAALSAGAVFDVAGQQGLDTRATLWLARVEAAAGDPRALERLAWVLEVASPTWAWPQVVHPRTRGGSAGEGDHLAAAAELCATVRDLLVREAPGPAGLVLSPVVPPSWLGAGWEAHDLPTAHGRLGFAVRWHGERPALLWELDRHDGVGEVRLTIPGLDPTWSTVEPRGEALLAPPPPPPAGGAPAEPVPRGGPSEASSSFG